MRFFKRSCFSVITSIVSTAIVVAFTLNSDSLQAQTKRARTASSKNEAVETVWKEFDRLVGEQKITQALNEGKRVLSSARALKNDRLITESLLRICQMQIGLDQYEDAVKFLKSEVWPLAPSERVLLNLYYGKSLAIYSSLYAYEIHKREMTSAAPTDDIRTWTMGQLGDEISRTFSNALKEEKALSSPIPDFYKSYVEKGNFPDSIRPTLRDVVVYLAVDHLVDTLFTAHRFVS
jgi:hypothetical protein